MADAPDKAKASPLLTLLALGNFVVGMGAFVLIGIVSPIAEGLGVSTADVGIVLTSYAIAYALLSPIGAALTGRLPRRTVLTAALGMFCVGSLISALAPSLTVLAASRVLVAMGAALFTPLAAGVAVAVASPEQRGRALAKVYGGMTLAQVAGVPFGAWLAYRFGWHAPFFVVAGAAALCAAVLVRSIPANVSFPAGNLSSIVTALGDRRLMIAVTFTATVMAAVYVLFTFFAPLIEASAGSNPETRAAYLMLFGIGAVSGNHLGGILSDKLGPFRTLVMVCAAHILLLPVFSFTPLHPVVLAVLVFVWSNFAWCFVAPQQARLVTIAPQSAALSLALNAAMIYLGIAIGSAAGGELVAWAGLGGLGLAASGMAVLALIHLVWSDRVARRA